MIEHPSYTQWLFSLAECFTDVSMTFALPLLSSLLVYAKNAPNAHENMVAIEYPIKKRFVRRIEGGSADMPR